MSTPQLHINPISEKDAIPFHLLELADPSREHINSYLENGTCYIAKLGSQSIGALVLERVNETTLEIKNIAISESEQGKGYGKVLLLHAEELSRQESYKKLIIATGNSSIGQLALYQKAGFEIDGIEKNFFLENYIDPIFENGIQCKHKIFLSKKLDS